MRKNKFVLILTLVAFCVISFANLKDVSTSPFSTAIEKLYAFGIVEAEDNLFNPSGTLSRAEAAEWIVKTFKLSAIYPMVTEEEVQKKFVYTDPLGVIDEGFVVPSAKDTVGIDGEEYIEGLIKVRAIEVVDGMYRPYEAITGVEFGQAIARVVFGVDEEIDYGAKLAELVYAPAELLSLKRPLRREEAAQILSNFVDNPNFQVITILATADIHGHIEPYTPSGAKYPIGAMEKMAYYVSTERAIQYQRCQPFRGRARN
jgi:hypothetical protein